MRATEIYTLSLHDALPISPVYVESVRDFLAGGCTSKGEKRSEEHTSELQSLRHLVCRLLLEKKDTALTSLGPNWLRMPVPAPRVICTTTETVCLLTGEPQA